MSRRRRAARWGGAALLLGLVVSGPVRADAPPGVSEAFLEGNRLYGEGDFPGAAAAYGSILEKGATAPQLEYNLANALLKTGTVGRAILHYRRALRMEPLYESAAENLEYARSLTQDVKPEETEELRLGWVRRLRLGPETTGALLFFAFTAFLAIGAARLGRWRGRAAPLIVQGVTGAAALLLVGALVFEWSQTAGKVEGVVLAPEVEVRSGPAETYTVSFRLHDGTEVRILRQAAGWREIKVSDTLQGWAPAEAVSVI